MAPNPSLTPEEGLLNHLSDDDLRRRVKKLRAEPRGGCDACRFADPFSDRLCTIPDISAEDFDLGVSGFNCSQYQPRQKNPRTKELQPLPPGHCI